MVVGGCQHLRTLDIGNNRFHVPLWIGSGAPQLNILSLKSNRFTGEIPSELSQLQLLDLSNNSLTGLIIPREFGKLSSMKNPEIIWVARRLHLSG
jgi:Leucine-rich repeat (LRR) protein